MDSLIHYYGFDVPAKWTYYSDLKEVDSTDIRRVYFKENPEEMYLISFSGMLLLADVYNPAIDKDDWVAKKELMPKEEELRIRNRFQVEILDRIEAMAKRDRLPDSVIYFK